METRIYISYVGLILLTIVIGLFEYFYYNHLYIAGFMTGVVMWQSIKIIFKR